MDKPGKRISSIFSLSSNTSAKSGTSSNVGSTAPPKKPSRDASPARSPRRYSDIRPSTSTPNLRVASSPTHHSPAMTTSFVPVRSSTPDGAGSMLPPLDTLKPLPNRVESSGASRPGSRASSRGASRPASPTKFRPLTPTNEPKQLSKRKSWLPGRSRPGTRDGEGAFDMPQAWIVTTVPQEKSMYDPTPLATFQKVGSESSAEDSACSTTLMLSGAGTMGRKLQYLYLPSWARPLSRALFQD